MASRLENVCVLFFCSPSRVHQCKIINSGDHQLVLSSNTQGWRKLVGRVGVCPPRFCQNRRQRQCATLLVLAHTRQLEFISVYSTVKILVLGIISRYSAQIGRYGRSWLAGWASAHTDFGKIKGAVVVTTFGLY